MPIRTLLPRAIVAIASLFLLLLSTGRAAADLFIFKDGFVVEGRLKQEGTVSTDGGMWIANGFFFVEDFSRRVFFSSKQVIDPMSRKYKLDDPVRFAATFGAGDSIYPIQRISSLGEWNDKAERQVKLSSGTGRGMRDLTLTQHVTMMSPTIIEMQTKFGSPPINWFSCYLTRELEPDVVRSLLSHHADFEITNKTSPGDIPARRWKLFRFFAHTDWTDFAEKELDSIARDLPGQAAEVKTNRAFLNEVKTQKAFDRIRNAYEAGQHERAQKLIKDFPEKDVKEEKLLTDYRELRTRYEAARTKLDQIHRLLKVLVEQVDNPAQKKWFGDVVKVIDDEVSYDEVLPPLRDPDKKLVGRLENFLTVANPDKLLKPDAKIDAKLATELLSFAVSGWVMGNAASEKDMKSSQRLWQARELIQEYLGKEEKSDRKALVDGYLKNSANAVTPEEFAYILRLMPQADPGDNSAGKTVELQVPGRSKVNYLLRLPTDYRHSRPYGYPVLFALHDGDEEPKTMIERWGAMADQYGFILVAPKWTGKLQTSYAYSTQEHAAVLDVLRDLRRQYRVDSDRVFLHGLGEGGTMTYDVGLAHPDLFAGILPMSGTAADFSLRYSANAQFLPIYAVCGECCEQMKSNRSLFSPMGSHQFPVFLITYRGRGPEWFSGEVPNAFDWMSRKVRATPLEEMGGNGQTLATMRTTDDRFYWITVNDMLESCINAPRPDWKGSKLPATLHAKIKEKNHINVDVFGVKRLTVWFGDNGMVDFTNPVKIVVGQTVYNQKVVPSLATLLEDFYARGDRQRLFFAKAEIDVK